MNRLLLFAVVALLALIGIVLVLNRQSTTSPAVTQQQTTQNQENVLPSPSATASATKEFTVTGSSFTFDPKELRVKKGDAVRITFKNAGGFHDFTIDEFNVKTKQIPAGEEDTIEFVADKTGSFAYYCSVGNHREMGMEGALVVE